MTASKIANEIKTKCGLTKNNFCNNCEYNKNKGLPLPTNCLLVKDLLRHMGIKPLLDYSS